jgi:predicted nicotinamide N-methyase
MDPEPIGRTSTWDQVEFVRGQTRLEHSALVPEIRLHLASEALSIWEATTALVPGWPGGGRSDTRPFPFWAFAWAGGQALARYVLDRPETVHDRSVLDVGSGSGIVAISAALAGARHVSAVDVDPLAAVAIRLNAEANGVDLCVRLSDLLGGSGLDADVVLAGDLFYERSLAGRVVDFLVRVEQRGALVLLGDLGRPYLPRDRLIPVASYDVPGTRALEDADVKRSTVWRFASTSVQRP